jgi:hypothetical protein
MKKSGLGDSPFFLPPEEKTEATPPLANLLDQKKKQEITKKTNKQKTEQPGSTDTTTPRYHGIKKPFMSW